MHSNCRRQVHHSDGADHAMELCQVVAECHPGLCANWTVAEGDRAALAGPQGCGKSLQIDAIVGDVVTSGRIMFAPDIRRLAVCRKHMLPRADNSSVRELLLMDAPATRSACRRHSSAHVAMVDVLPGRPACVQERPNQGLHGLEIDGLLDTAVKDLSPREAVGVGLARLAMWHPDVLLLKALSMLCVLLMERLQKAC